MVVLGWLVLLGLFAVELAAWAAFGVWGWHIGSGAGRWMLALGLPLVAIVLWGLVASPKAPLGHPVGTTVVKVAVFGGAVVSLWAAGRPRWALALLVATVAVHALAAVPAVRELRAG